jgi:predicted nucleotide-binding protein
VNVRVAVVCHHDAHAREATVGFVAQLGLQALTLPEPPNTTDSAFFDRLERLSDLHFAIVLLPASALDAASGIPKALSPELLLEFGFLLGTLGRSRICFLVSGKAAKAPPWDGVAGLPMDDAGLWRLLLARAMKQAGLDVDLNRAL